jgi:hypothetical protein
LGFHFNYLSFFLAYVTQQGRSFGISERKRGERSKFRNFGKKERGKVEVSEFRKEREGKGRSFGISERRGGERAR